jgi:glycosyltransferase involved in cell wall biosynthesis
MTRKLRIAVDCRIADFKEGTGSAVVSLAKALSESGSPEHTYTFIVRESMRPWISSYISGRCRLHCLPESPLSEAKAILRKFAPLVFVWRELRAKKQHLPVSDGFVESQQFDLVHFPTQIAYLTNLPSIYHPWDLQHLHFPEFFPKAEVINRERLYRAFCNQASCVCVQTEWTKQDILRNYDLPERKIEVIPWGSVFDSYTEPTPQDCNRVKEKFRLPANFFFYPAVTWPHKNHGLILYAMKCLREESGIVARVVFTGAPTAFKSSIDRLARNLEVSDQVSHLGFVSPLELQVIYRSATAMVFPSKFEGFGLPILEAFHARVPVLSSSATTLPEVAQDGALYFDPDSPMQLAEQMRKILDSEELRVSLVRKGGGIAERSSMKRTVARFCELYDRTARRSTT